jgi:hypothetical protein
MEITLDITRQQLVDNLQTLSYPDLRSVIVDSLHSEEVSEHTIIGVVSEILEKLLKTYTDEMEWYTERQLNATFSEVPPANRSQFTEEVTICEYYVTATQTAIDSVRAIAAGPGGS